MRLIQKKKMKKKKFAVDKQPSQFFPNEINSTPSEILPIFYLDKVGEAVVGILCLILVVFALLNDVKCDHMEQILNSELTLGREALVTGHLVWKDIKFVNIQHARKNSLKLPY